MEWSGCLDIHEEEARQGGRGVFATLITIDSPSIPGVVITTHRDQSSLVLSPRSMHGEQDYRHCVCGIDYFIFISIRM